MLPNSRGHATKRGLRVPNPNSRGPKEGGYDISPLHSRGSPNKGGQNQRWLPHTSLLGGPKEGRSATSPLHSRGSPTKGDKIRIGCLTHGVGIGNSPKSCPACTLRANAAPQKGGNAMSPLHSRGSPTPSPKGKSEVAIWIFWGTLALTLNIYIHIEREKKFTFFSIFFLHSRDSSLPLYLRQGVSCM